MSASHEPPSTSPAAKAKKPNGTSSAPAAETETSAALPAGEPRDPFDPAALRIDSTTNASLGVERPILVVPVRKPDRQMFFRVHPSPDMRIDCHIIELQNEREIYLVTPHIAAMLPGETKPARFLTCIPRVGGGIFLWPLKLPSEDGRTSGWAMTAQKAAELAETKWVRMQSNMGMGAYDVSTSTHIPDPVWPEISMRELLRIAFGDGRLIDRDDHPVIRQLLGSA